MGVGLKQSWGILGHSGDGFGGLGVVSARSWEGLVAGWGAEVTSVHMDTFWSSFCHFVRGSL